MGSDASTAATEDTRTRAPLNSPQAAALLRIGMAVPAGPEDPERWESIRHGEITALPGDHAWARMPTRSTATITLVVVGITGFLAIDPDKSPQVAPNEHEARGSVPVSPHPRQEQSMNQVVRIATAGVIGAAATFGTAHAQQSVQWRVEDGGNGHWYAARAAATGEVAEQMAAAAHGHLATLTTQSENAFAAKVVQSGHFARGIIGLLQLSNQAQPDAGWYWVTGEPLKFTNWTDFGGGLPFVAPDDTPCACCTVVEDNQCNQGMLDVYAPQWFGKWDDLERGVSSCGETWNHAALIEWDADCNHDGIVDYGQCRDGSLPDYDGNNIPDCCERGKACVVGDYPVQWRVEDGGNGHWYGVTPERGTWQHDRERAQLVGGDLATVTNDAESKWLCLGVMNAGPWATEACWMGMKLSSNGAFQWVSGEPVTWTNWYPSVPHSPPFEVVWITGPRNPGGANPCFWNDADPSPSIGHTYFGLIEWSADCNQDGIVDYGQILTNQLADANANGIPDVCEGPTCASADLTHNGIVDGSDLGVLLGFWGPRNQVFPQADINGDGVVNGADLGIMLSFWGTCP
jgi:hypothetical protein